MSAASQIRASYYLVSPLIAQSGGAQLPWPGGCDVGQRGMDLHFDVYRSFGDIVTTSGSGYEVVPGTVNGAVIEIELPFRSRGATIAALLRSVAARRSVVVRNPNLSAEVLTLVDAFSRLGMHASVSEDALELRHVDNSPHPPVVIPVPGDKIEAGTLLAALAITRGTGEVCGVNGSHLSPVVSLLREIGFEITANPTTVGLTTPERPLRAFDVRIVSSLDPESWDADWEPALLVLALTLTGLHYCEDKINPGRHGNLLPQLEKMGAVFSSKTTTGCWFSGSQDLKAENVYATDIRTGTALVLAGLMASGATMIDNLAQIRRGHADLVGKLQELGASIAVVER